MKLILSLALLLLAFAANAQAPTPVPIPKEPHHHLVLENEYVRVFRVSIPGHDATLLHQHDVPYIYVSLGPADVINAVQGKPEARIVMADGQVGYSPGHFAHIARTDAGSSFDNVTIELLKPQGEPHNWCDKVAPDEALDCRAQIIEGQKLRSLFRTDSVKVFLETLDSKASASWQAYSDALIVVLGDSQLKVSFDKKSQNLDAEQAYWIPRHTQQGVRKISFKNLRKGVSRYLLILFEGYAPENRLPSD
jgi:hypothetical protein